MRSISALREAVSAGLRVVVTSGGHCLEGFVADPDVRVILDISPMKRVYFDAERRAVAIEAGATVGEAFRALSEHWGTSCRSASIQASGWAATSPAARSGFSVRQLGLAADYLYAVEVVTVDGSGRPSTVVATCEPSDPNRELWWAHTGGGGGNFGIVTRYWFRSPEASGAIRARLLPRTPESVTTFTAEWSWDNLDEPIVPATSRKPGRVERAEQRRRFAERVPLVAVGASSQAVREDHHPRPDHGRRAAERQIDDYLAALERRNRRAQGGKPRRCRGSTSR